ncbi:MAG: hypothetical protein LCH41_03935 [Armatimonadetes bacterium]|nr:hypothetical protein [Armatimonadota bacterium]
MPPIPKTSEATIAPDLADGAMRPVSPATTATINKATATRFHAIQATGRTIRPDRLHPEATSSAP